MLLPPFAPRAAFPEWQAPTTVTIRQRQGEFDVIGIERPSDQGAMK